MTTTINLTGEQLEDILRVFKSQLHNASDFSIESHEKCLRNILGENPSYENCRQFLIKNVYNNRSPISSSDEDFIEMMWSLSSGQLPIITSEIDRRRAEGRWNPSFV